MAEKTPSDGIINTGETGRSAGGILSAESRQRVGVKLMNFMLSCRFAEE
jgi:hypothetical protein